MKVVLVNGSPHEKGCTYTALKEMADEFGRQGVETEIVHIGKAAIHGCIGCGYCRKAGRCVFDDAVNALAEKLVEADGLVFGSPVFYAGISGQLKCFMDRLFYSQGARLQASPPPRWSARGAADALPPSMISTAFSPSTACRWFPRNTGTRCTEIRPTRSARMKRAFKPCARWHATWPGCSNAWRPAVRQACPSRSRKRLFAPILSDKSRFRKGSGLNQLPQNRQLFFAQMDSRLTQRRIGMLHQKRMAHAVQHGFIVEVVAKSGSFFL